MTINCEKYLKECDNAFIINSNLNPYSNEQCIGCKLKQSQDKTNKIYNLNDFCEGIKPIFNHSDYGIKINSEEDLTSLYFCKDRTKKNPIKISLKDKLISYTSKPIIFNKEVLENIYGKVILLKEIHNSWTREGVFIENTSCFDTPSFIKLMHYNDGELFFAVSPLDFENDILTKKEDHIYLLRMLHGGGSYPLCKEGLLPNYSLNNESLLFRRLLNFMTNSYKNKDW